MQSLAYFVVLVTAALGLVRLAPRSAGARYSPEVAFHFRAS